jgi:hypothetical protein
VASNEVSYYQSQGDRVLQFGTFPVNSKDWTVCLFSEEFDEKPVVVSGIPTFNNILAMTHRVNAATTGSFKFQLNTWQYLNNPPLTKTDYLSMAALPAGDYNFGGLQAAADAVTGVSGQWDTVLFGQPFGVPPAVFCTQVSNNTFFATMPAIRNVTENGFELCLRCEEAITPASILPETVNYLAVEPGRGHLGMNRITVGRTGEGEKGISATPVVLGYDSTYSMPMLFASMLTSADNFASTLRYYSTGEHEFTILKQRELSGQITAMKEDKLGWMVMDIAPGQPVSNREAFVNVEFSIFPNPAVDCIRLSLKEPARIEIYDLSGRKLLETPAGRSVNVDLLPAGIYLLRVERQLPVKFIKQ